MYNPTRHGPQRTLHQRRQPPPGAGTSHSQIVRKYGATFAVPSGTKVDTPTGVTVTLCETEAFQTHYEAIRGGCATGRLLNKSDDRTFYVLSGVCFFLIYDTDGETVKDSLKCLAGGAFTAPCGVIYEIATTGDQGCELHVTETMLYERHLVHLTAPVADTSTATDQFIQREAAVPVQRREQDPNMVNYAIQRAQAVAERRRNNDKVATPMNANSANVIGVNPKPGGFIVEE